jgi:N utilization substance protein A
MNNELIAMLEYLERERSIKREVLIEAVESAIMAAARKSVETGRDLKVSIDSKTGEITGTAKLIVVDKVVNRHDEILLSKARQLRPEVVVGEELEVPVSAKELGRIAAQTARQAIMQRIRQEEKRMIFVEFRDRAGDIVTGTVRRFERQDVIIDLGKFEALMPNRERVPTEDYAVGDKIRAYVVAVENSARGPEIILSRSHPNFVRRLFETEVAEIADRTVEIKALAREAGYRTKVAVWASNEKVDPVGACVGMKGARVKNIVKELNNEKVDIIRWSADVKELVVEALKPAKLNNIATDDGRKTVYVKVDESQLALAIGRRGQNSRLTERLTGWKVQIEEDNTKKDAFNAAVNTAAKALGAAAHVTEAEADLLIKAGMNSVDVIAECEPEDIAGVLGCDAARATDILSAARGGRTATPA